MSVLEQKLALSKKMTQMERSVASQPQQMQTPQYVYNDPRQEIKPYNAKEDLKRLQNGLPSDLSNCKLPQSIIESIMKNPLTDMSVDPQMDSFTENLGESLGISQSASIIEQLNKYDDEKKNKFIKESSNTTSSSIDYEMIKMIVENVIDNKLDAIKQTFSLNENRNYNQTPHTLKTMQLGDKFLFCDSDDNVYECVMEYKGKRKKKQK